MSEQLTLAEKLVLPVALEKVYGSPSKPRGCALQIDETRFLIDCLSCKGTCVRVTRPGVSSVVGGSFSCPRCGGTGEEVVGVLAAHKICGRDGVDYMQGWDEGRALRAAGKSTSNSSTLEKQRR